MSLQCLLCRGLAGRGRWLFWVTGVGTARAQSISQTLFNHIRPNWQADRLVGLGTLRLFVVLLFRSMIEIISKAFSLTLYTPHPDSFCLASPLNVLLFHSVISRCYLHFSFSSFTDKVIYGFGAAVFSFLHQSFSASSPFLHLPQINRRIMSISFNLQLYFMNSSSLNGIMSYNTKVRLSFRDPYYP